MQAHPLVAAEGCGPTLDPDALRAALANAPSGLVVAWSGGLGEDMWARHPHTWGPRGWAALHAACDALEPVLAAWGAGGEGGGGGGAGGGTLLLRTHARHVLSDPRACLKFLAERAERAQRGGRAPTPRIALLPDLAAMIDASMLPHVEDHLDRLFALLPALLGPHGAVLASVPSRCQGAVGGAEEEADAHHPPALMPVPLGQGCAARAALVARWHAATPPDTQAVLLRG